MATIFAFVILLFNAAPTLGILLAIPVGTLTALAFASWIAAFMSTQYDTTAFNAIWRFGITPLFLFSGTFFPIDQLPARSSGSPGSCRYGMAWRWRARCRSGS